MHEGKKPFHCTICDSSFRRNTHLTRHIASVHDGKKQIRKRSENQNVDENFEGFSYENQNSGEQFENYDYENNEYSEENVGYENEYEEYIETVDITAENEQKNQCSLCGKSFPKPSKLKLHITTVHEGDGITGYGVSRPGIQN